MSRPRRPGLLALLLLLPHLARADRLMLQLSDIRQAQFAGYYVAEARGYYAQAGLDVRILPGIANGDTLPLQPRPGIDIWSAWLPQALAAREKGTPLVNFAQIFPHSGLEIVCRKTSEIHSAEDLKGKTIAVWPDDTRLALLAWMRRLQFAVPQDVKLLTVPRTQGEAATAPLLNRDAACITALNYDQYWQLIAAGVQPTQLQVFHFGDFGISLLQDGLYATGSSLADPARSDRLVRFLRATVQGWQYAVTHQDEAVAIVLAGSGPVSDAAKERQTRMMSAVARLTESGLQRMGYLEPAAFDRTVQILLQSGPDRPIDAAPAGAWTHDIWQRAGK